MAEFDIFISYRRNGGFETAKHLFDLFTHDGYLVSFDIDALREGDFDFALLKRVESCQDFILIVDPHTFDRTLDSSFNPRNDWLRQELSYALYLEKNVIPVLLGGASFPENLPDDIRSVITKNGPSYSKDYFDSFYVRLKSFLHSKPISGKTISSGYHQVIESAKRAEIHIETDTDCAVFRFNEKILDAICGEDNIVYLQKGKHRLSFVSHLFADVSEQLVLTIPSSDYSDIITIYLQHFELAKVPFEVVEKEGKYGCVDPKGKLRIPYIYDFIEPFTNSLVTRVSIDDKWGLINKTGEEIVPLAYDNLSFPNDQGFFLAEKDGKCGAIDSNGRVIMPFQYEYDRFPYLPDGDDLISFIKNDKYGYIDSQGKEAIPFIFNNVDDCGFDRETGLVSVEINGKWGFIDMTGKTVIPFQFDRAWGFSSKMAYVKKNGKVGFINDKGEVVIPFEYDDAGIYFLFNYVGVEKNGKWGIIDKKGLVILPLIYDNIRELTRDNTVQVKKDDKWYLVDLQSGSHILLS